MTLDIRRFWNKCDVANSSTKNGIRMKLFLTNKLVKNVCVFVRVCVCVMSCRPKMLKAYSVSISTLYIRQVLGISKYTKLDVLNFITEAEKVK